MLVISFDYEWELGCVFFNELRSEFGFISVFNRELDLLRLEI